MGNEIIVTWENIGTLSSFKFTHGTGVYLFVYDNKRIIYVGQTTDQCFCERISQHKSVMLHGGFSCFLAEENENIYDLMKVGDRKYKSYAELALHKNEIISNDKNNYFTNKIWLPGKEKSGMFWKHLITCQEFKDFWQDKIIDYQTKISVYITEIVLQQDLNHKQVFKCLESNIQELLRKSIKNYIGYFLNNKQYSWHGKQEYTKENDLKKYKFIFDGEMPQILSDIAEIINL